MKTTPQCIECHQNVSWGVHEFSQREFGYCLCMKCQYKLDRSKATDYAKELYLALKSRNIHVVLEYNDGNKTVDIAIPGKLYIEVNGGYHNTKKQALTDLTRSVYSLDKHIPTIPIPNYLLNDPHTFYQTVSKLIKACRTV
jgi:hypothetical protein